ncbi:hypothetical protein [Streptomyces sp. NPDC006691]|uniref:hypothetical protein n=1 Tax=Streptomyces sp. NPDC006691 TaxID=3364757 RepID=UPI0036B6138A
MAAVPAEPTPGATGPASADAPTTQPEAPGTVGTAPAQEASGTRPPSPATAPDSTVEPPSSAESVTPVQPGAGQTRESEEDPADAEESEETALSTTLHGLPSKVVPGSGWQNLTFRAANSSDKAIKSVEVYTLLAAIDHQGRDRWQLLTLQWYDEDAGVWNTVEPDIGYLTTLAEIAPGEHTDIALRMKVDADMPVGVGDASALGIYLYDDDTYGQSESPYSFDIVLNESEPPATSQPGSKPQAPGDKPAPPADLTEPSATSDAAASGTPSVAAGPFTDRPDADESPIGRADSGAALAETGSDSASGWMLGAGAASIALGTALAGAAHSRRRRTS